MKLVKQENIDRNRWDNLVRNDEHATIYSQSVFLDQLAENWMLLVNDDYSIGLPIPFTIRLGLKGIYTPNFIRTIDWVGLTKENELSVISEAETLLKNSFKFANLNMLSASFSLMESTRVFQQLEDKVVLNSQAKRSIKKFQKSNLKIQKVELHDVIGIISGELKEKVKSLNSNDMNRFEALLNHYPKENLWVLGVVGENHVQGGLVFIQWNNTFHYVKGGTLKSAKDSGAMYAMMEFAINFAVENNFTIDFGGSNVAGVRQFNCAFGATDVSYSEWKWDNSPMWFRWLKAIKNKKKSSN